VPAASLSGTVGLCVSGPGIAPKKCVGRFFQGRLEASLKGSRYTNELGGSGACRIARRSEGGGPVLYTLAVVLLILWLLGMVSGYTIGAFIHVLLVIAVVLVLVQLISGRSVTL
jgi:hypothetical protein